MSQYGQGHSGYVGYDDEQRRSQIPMQAYPSPIAQMNPPSRPVSMSMNPLMHPSNMMYPNMNPLMFPAANPSITNNNAKMAGISEWLSSTPLPTSLAFPSNDTANSNLTAAPMPGRINATTMQPLVKTEKERRREKRVEHKAKKKGTGGWVNPVGHDPAAIFYNPANPIVRTRGDLDPRASKAVKPARAVSRKEAQAMLLAAKDSESDTEKDNMTEKKGIKSADSSSDDDDNRVLGKVAPADSESEEETAMERIRDRLLKLAQEKGLADHDNSDADDNSAIDDDDDMPLAAAMSKEKEHLFRKPGRTTASIVAKSVSNWGGKNDKDEDGSDEEIDARILLGQNGADSDSDSSDREDPNVRKYFESLAVSPPGDPDEEDEMDAIPLIQMSKPQANPNITTDALGTDVEPITTQQQLDENKIRSEIYSEHVPRVQQPKSNPAEALDAIQNILPQIYHLSNYPQDQKSLSDLCYAVLQRISKFNSMTIPAVADAQLTLANLYVQGVPNYDLDTHIPDFHKAFALYESSARRGNLDAVFNAALCYEKGVGVGASYPKAVHNYKKAALRNHPGAMFRLGTALQKGDLGLPPNPRDAIKWLRLATKYATRTYPHALYEFAMMHETGITGLVYTDYVYMMELLAQGALLGHGGCQVKLGEIYSDGLYGCEKSVAKSVYFYSMAADSGNPEGMFELGGIYLSGAKDESTNLDIPSSVSDSVRWVSLAAECGLPRALYAMGYFAEQGMTVAQGKNGTPNPKAALSWYKRAAVAGEEKAVRKLEELGVDIDWKAFRKLEANEKANQTNINSLQVGGGVGKAAKRVQQGVTGGLSELRNKVVGRHSQVDEELDGGHKCMIM
ncbi:hypothetical protein HDU78_008774 [Chytriomyces hyalinus]|nr:hypothetical protein HDU78_008774 [Chytriomyces hyalinus]